MAVYEHLIEDLATGRYLGSAPFEGFDYEDILQGAGTATATITLPGDLTLAAVFTDMVQPQKRVWHVARDGVIDWSGVIWAVPSYDPGTRVAQVAAAQLHSVARKGRIRHTLRFEQADQFGIAGDLVRYMQGHQLEHCVGAPITFPRPPGADLSIAVVEDTPSGQLRDRTYYVYEDSEVGAKIEELADVEGGFEFRFDAYLDAGQILRRFRCATRVGRPASVSGLVFQLGDVRSFAWSVDGTQGANSVVALGAGEADSMLYAKSTNYYPLLNDGFPLLEDSVSFKDVKEAPTLQAHADKVSLQRGYPVRLPTIEVDGSTDPQIGTYGVGDGARIVVQPGLDPWFPGGLDEEWRIVRRKVAVSAAGDERVSLTVSEV